MEKQNCKNIDFALFCETAEKSGFPKNAVSYIIDLEKLEPHGALIAHLSTISSSVIS